jgi:ABC-type antimicrobial peptide transport system permease subunit
MLRNYIVTAFRHLSRNKIYSLINIVGLGIGLAAAMLILLYVKDEVSYDQFHSQKANIYRMVRRMQNTDGSSAGGDGYSPLIPGERYAANIPEVKGYVRIINNFQDIQRKGSIISQQILLVDPNFLTVFSFPLKSGNPQTALTQPHTIVITEEMAKREFGTADALGKTILVKTDEPANTSANTPASAAPAAFQPYTVTGIAENCPENSSIKFEALALLNPQAPRFAEWQNNWLGGLLNTFLVLTPGADPNRVESRMKNIYETEAHSQLADAHKAGMKWTPQFVLQPLTATHLSKDYPPIDGLVDASSPVFSYILSGIAGFILLIACINFVNLTVARSLRRAKEIGIRKVIGSSRSQLVIRFMGESAVFCIIAFTLAIALVQLLLPLFNELSGKALALSYLLDTRLVAQYIALFLLTAFAAGFYPALVLSGYSPVKTLYGRFTLSGRNGLQHGLVTLQFTLASFLIVATAIIAAQFNYLVHKPLGYDDKNLVIVNNWELNPAKFATLAAALRQSPDVLGVSGRNLGWDNEGGQVEGRPEKINTTIETIDAGYPKLLSIPIVAGRNFSAGYATDSTQSVLVNETFAREAGWSLDGESGAGGSGAGRSGAGGSGGGKLAGALGQNIHVYDKDVRVIGVVKDHYFQPLNVKIKAQIFSLTMGRGVKSMFIKLRPGTEAAALAFIERTFKAYMPLSPFYYSFKDQSNRREYAAEEKWKQILSFGAIVTIFISCIGLFGLAVFAAEKRTREIGIRKVLGASVSGLAATLSTDFLRLVVLALLIAMPLAWLAAGQWLSNYPYRVTLTPWTFLAAAGLVVGIAVLTVATQAVRAARANPVKSLRSE